MVDLKYSKLKIALVPIKRSYKGFQNIKQDRNNDTMTLFNILNVLQPYVNIITARRLADSLLRWIFKNNELTSGLNMANSHLLYLLNSKPKIFLGPASLA